MDFSDEKREMLFSASMKKLNKMVGELNELYEALENRINIHVPSWCDVNYHEDPIEPVVDDLGKKFNDVEKMLHRCEGYMDEKSPRCYKVLILTYKMHMNQIFSALDNANALRGLMTEGETFENFIDAIDKEVWSKEDFDGKTGVSKGSVFRLWNTTSHT